jgi:outer membrane protein assembly factor BamD (BamD/ComL family)
MKQDFTMYIYKLDKRTKTGERLVSTTVWTARDEASMEREIYELHIHHYPRGLFRIEALPKMVTVKNLMTGKDVEIDRDTPWCCNPASEAYWSM